MGKSISTLAGLGLVCLALGAAAAPAEPSLNRVLAKKSLVVGLDEAFPPLGFRDERGELAGFDVDLARAVCARLGIALTCRPIAWDEKERELESGRVDCIWSGFTLTPARQARWNFTEPYLANAQVLVVRADSPAHGRKDLAERRLGLQAGSSAADVLDATPNFKELLAEVVAFKSIPAALAALEAGGVEAVLMDALMAYDRIGPGGKPYRMLAGRFAAEQYGVAFRKDDQALRDAVQAQLSAMARDGSLAELAVHWFGANIAIVK
ncbi:MAG: amino acid ABC transporter substrate-binding protein [Kiritimatiellia bacterium]